ncbi:MAG: sulfurase [Paracoccaceae bacterium]
MPALMKTQHRARVVFLGHTPDRAAGLRSAALDRAELTFDGIPGEDHGGATRPSCSRVVTQYPKGTQIRNVRQLSVLSQEELDQIAANMGLKHLDPSYVGASMVIEGITDWTYVPPSSRLVFDSGASITVDMENRPCTLPAKEIEADHAGFGAKFKAAAKAKRGVTAWVERPGLVELDMMATLHIPDQRAWAP